LILLKIITEDEKQKYKEHMTMLKTERESLLQTKNELIAELDKKKTLFKSTIADYKRDVHLEGKYISETRAINSLY
jgi:hypothetical protein